MKRPFKIILFILGFVFIITLSIYLTLVSVLKIITTVDSREQTTNTLQGSKLPFKTFNELERNFTHQRQLEAKDGKK